MEVLGNANTVVPTVTSLADTSAFTVSTTVEIVLSSKAVLLRPFMLVGIHLDGMAWYLRPQIDSA